MANKNIRKISPAYMGTEPYMFTSYAHLDSNIVFPEIIRFQEQGYNVWYDEGIAPGNEWPEEIANALLNCSLFVVFITPRAVESKNVRNEIYYALHNNIPVIAIHLIETELEGGLALSLQSIQAILKYNMSEYEYVKKYTRAFKENGFGLSDSIESNIAIKKDNNSNFNKNSTFDDILQLLLYWKDNNTHEYRLAKTKIITIVVTIIMVAIYILDAIIYGSDIFSNILSAIILFTIPTFIVGYIIHFFTNRS